MNLNDYQLKASATAQYRTGTNSDVTAKLYIAPYLDLGGEAGEVIEKAKKLARDKDVHFYGGSVSEEDRQALKKELGDVMWAVANISFDLGLWLSDVGETNIIKITSRKARGKVGGSGDDR